jgi:hypothetical protein
MRIILPALIALAAASGGCANYKIYETELDVCSSGNGTVKSATVTRSSGDPKIDAYAMEKVAPSMVYQGSEAVTCRPLTVEYRMTGEQAS